VCEFHSTAIPPAHLPALLTSLVGSLQDESTKVAVQGCYSVRDFFRSFISLTID
jgi:hypothetical protein